MYRKIYRKCKNSEEYVFSPPCTLLLASSCSYHNLLSRFLLIIQPLHDFPICIPIPILSILYTYRFMAKNYPYLYNPSKTIHTNDSISIFIQNTIMPHTAQSD
ncbi:unknown [Bacteroides sp. CAG:875]|nr:unknown [Bacteroides sp. CAG:875]